MFYCNYAIIGVIMKNKIENPENEFVPTAQLVNKKDDKLRSDQNAFSNTENNQSIKSSKIIKGKVKIQANNSRLKLTNTEWLDDEEELQIVWKRMLLFLKFIFLFLIVSSIFILIKRNVL